MTELELVVGLLELERIPYSMVWKNLAPLEWSVIVFYSYQGQQKAELKSIYDAVDFVRAHGLERSNIL